MIPSTKKNYIHYFIIITFFIIFSSISLVNHYLFRTYAWDLGINNNAIYDYAHFRWNDCMLMQPQFTNILSDHFALFPILISPFYWIFGSYTMLLFQIAAILFGGYGIYVFFKTRSEKEYIPLLAMVHFFSVWGIYSALAFDYHDNVVGTMFVPWFLHFFDKRQWKKSLLFFVLILISKENMALWAVFIAAGLIFLNFRDRQKLKYAFWFCLGAFFYFVLIVKLVMPALANEGRDYLHFHYDAVGKNFSGAIKTIFTKPRYTFSLLFENHLKDEVANGIKSELHFTILCSGGFVLLIRPQYLLMLAPVYTQKLFNDDFGKWGLNAQYSIEFAPILTIALFGWISDFNETKKKMYLSIGFTLLTLYTTLASIDNRVSKWYNSANQKFYAPEHYKKDFDVKKMYEVLKLIPDNAVVSAQSPLVPHLAFRDYIYQFPDVANAEYIVLLEKESPYPLNQEEYTQKKKEYFESPEWQVIYNENHTCIFRKKRH